MIWRFADGTTVELGGNVEGPKLFAQWLRMELDQRKTISIWPLPSGSIPFDKHDPAHLDHMLGYLSRQKGVKLTDRPDDIPALPPPPWGDEPADEALVH